MLFSHLNAQENRKLRISGKIVSNETGNPVPYAHIRIQESTVGTVTNSSGDFALSFSEQHLGDSLIFSSIAFRTLKLPLKEILVGRDLEIKLIRGELVLEEMEVEDDEVSSFELVQKAVSKIEENYDPTPAMLTAFYREFASVYAKEMNRVYKKKRRKDDSQNLDESYAYNVTEGVFEVYKYPYFGKGGNRSDEMKLIKGRRLEYVPQTDGDSIIQSIMMKFKHKGGPHDMLEKDVLKDLSIAGFLKKNADKKYRFRTLGLVEHKGRGAFKVVFDQKEKVDDDLYKGEIYIDTANYAFLHINFSKSPRGIDHQSFGVPAGMLKFITGVKIDLVDFRGSLSYQEFRGKWYPEYHRYAGELRVTMDKENNRKETNLDIMLSMRGDMLVTNIDKRHVGKLSSDEEFKKGDHMDDFVGDYNDEFWETHNYILPSSDLIEKINRKKNRN